MTNAEKYLKPDMRVAMWKDYNQTGQKSKSIWQWLDQEAKPTLTEDERVILRNISKQFIKVGRDDANTIYFIFEEFTGKEVKYYANVFDNVFQFIKERKRILY